MNSFSRVALSYLLGAMLFAGHCTVAADNPPAQPEVQKTEEKPANKDDSKHEPAGTRAMLPSEYIAEKVRLASEQQNGVEEEVSADLSDIVGADASVGKYVQKGTKAGIYYTTHAGAFHCPMGIYPSVYGTSTIELEDNSIWTICPDDTLTLYNWLPTDVVVITPNHAWFSVYDYCFVNQNTGTCVQANLTKFLNPLYHTIFNHRVVAIDDVLQMVWLEDGSVWSITSLDYSTRWMLNDTVIIGINDDWLSSSRPNILINANILHKVRTNCVN